MKQLERFLKKVTEKDLELKEDRDMNKIKKAGALIFKDKKMLVVKPVGKPFFINPGGKYKSRENDEQCLRRELKEELGVNLVSCKHYKTYNIGKAAHVDKPLLLELFLVKVQGKITASGEIEKIEWLGEGDFLSKKFNLAPSFSVFVPDLIKDDIL